MRKAISEMVGRADAKDGGGGESSARCGPCRVPDGVRRLQTANSLPGDPSREEAGRFIRTAGGAPLFSCERRRRREPPTHSSAHYSSNLKRYQQSLNKKARLRRCSSGSGRHSPVRVVEEHKL